MSEKRFIKGLFKDTGHIDQPDGSWRHARNMVLNEKDGSVGNEGGTEMSGFIEVNDDKTILFVTDIVNSVALTSIYPRSEIGLWEKGVYTTIFNPIIDPASGGKLTNDLKFSQDYPIEGTFKIDSKGDLLIGQTI